MKLSQLYFLGICMALCHVAYGNTITFDDLPATGFNSLFDPPISPPNGYQNLNWHELFVLDTSAFPTSGIVNGTVSPNNVLVIPDFRPPPTGNQTLFPPATISAATPFLLESGYFTAVSLNGVMLEVIGLNGSTTEFDEKFTVNATAPSFLMFPDLPVTELDFTTSGGDVKSNPGYFGGSGSGVVLDNLTIDFVTVPEVASTALLLAASAGGLALLRKRFS